MYVGTNLQIYHIINIMNMYSQIVAPDHADWLKLPTIGYIIIIMSIMTLLILLALLMEDVCVISVIITIDIKS